MKNQMHRKKLNFLIFLLLTFCCELTLSFREYSKQDLRKLREEVRQMFQHAYNGYLKYASGYDELRPLSCDGINTWGSYSLTLIDALDTLVVMGNHTEFRRVVKLLTEKSNFDADINVSVFETNIRIVGGLLSAHLMSEKAGLELEEGWPCNGPLLRLAEDVAKRLLPAFDTKTGMPYGTVNLRYGVPSGETSVTCTAGVGTFIVEFGTLSRLTGNPIYEEVALNALYALWNHRSPIGLFGNHIDVQTGRWTAQDSGIGAGVDSFYEYLVKGAILLNRPELLELFYEGRKGIDKYLRRDDWHVWVSMSKGQVTLPVFQSLEAYWPGVLSLVGETSLAMRTLHNYHSVWKQYGFLPEFYNIPNGEASVNRENYPLRPELIESVMYLYRATKDPFLLEVGEDILRSIQYSAKTSCGYATIKNVRDHRKEDRMESFFLAETTKYLYLLFDENNFLHNEGEEGTILSSEINKEKECVIDAGGYIFNTEAHPIDPSALQCCYDKSTQKDFFKDFDFEQFVGESLKIKRIPHNYQSSSDLDSTEDITNTDDKKLKCSAKENEDMNDDNVNSKETARKIAMEVIKNFEKIEIGFVNDDYIEKFENDDLIKIKSPNVLNKNENSKQEQLNNEKEDKNIKYDNIQSEIELVGDQDMMHDIKLLKVAHEQILQTIKRITNVITSHFNITTTLNANETIDLSDFWNNNETSASEMYISDFIEKIKYNEQFDIFEEIIGDLAQLQYKFRGTSEELSTDLLLFKMLKFLNEAYNNSNLENFDETLNEIDKNILEIIIKAQKKYEYQIISKSVDMQLLKVLYEFPNLHYLNDFEIITKRFKQASKIKAEITNNVSKSENIILKKELFKFLKERIKLQMSYREKLKLKISMSKEHTLSKSTITENNDYDDANILISFIKYKEKVKQLQEKLLKKFENEHGTIIFNSENILKSVIPDDDIIKMEKSTSKSIKQIEDKDDDIIIMEKSTSKSIKQIEDKETGVGTVEQVNLDDSLSTSEKSSKLQKIQSASTTTIQKNMSNVEQSLPVGSPDSDENSIFSEFVKTILKTTMQSKDKFSANEFLLKIRTNGLYVNKSQNFELFHCKAQPFLNRFSLRGQFFDDD